MGLGVSLMHLIGLLRLVALVALGFPRLQIT